MKYSILSAKESQLLENLIVKHGQIVTTDNIAIEAKGSWDEKHIYVLISKLTKRGWLIRIKRGLYAISDLSTRGFLSLSPYIVANLLVKDSYVSFEAALHHHGMFDQLTNKIISVSLTTYKGAKLQGTEYSFVKTKAEHYFGWEEADIENKKARIATAEKAIVDMINFHRSKYSIDLVVEKLREHRKDLNLARLNEYLGKVSTTTVKIFGLLFDMLGIDSAYLHNLVDNSRTAHRMLAGATKFNAKWRLYYDEYFDKYSKTV